MLGLEAQGMARRARVMLASATAVVVLGLARPAVAQMGAGAGIRGYAQIDAQSATSTVSTQSYGVEGGWVVQPGLFIFVEGGRIRDISPEAFGDRAQAVTNAVAALAGGASVTYKQPVTFFVGGPKVEVSAAGGLVRPYVMAGIGIARSTRNVELLTATGTQEQFVTLGSDLSGSTTNAMFTAGAGIGLRIAGPLAVDLQYRFGRILASDDSSNVQRFGIGIGFEF